MSNTLIEAPTIAGAKAIAAFTNVGRKLNVI